MYDIKQVIVIRKDLNMRKGKMCAQAAHASMAVFTQHIHSNIYSYNLTMDKNDVKESVMIQWLKSSFAKIVLYVNSEEELLELNKKAKLHGFKHALIKDNGTTEFNGVPTYTALAIGPDYSKKIDTLTGDLKLL